jgi:DNA-binding transcriptional MerR regulator
MFKIGEFSKLARVTTRQLRYYEECGLLQANHIDHETGYRYYSAAQLPRLHRILALKDLGLSLDQIGRFLAEDISVDELRGMLAMKKAELEQVVKEELLRIQQIENRIAQLDSEGSLQNYDVLVQEIPEQRFLSVRTTVNSVRSGIDLVYEINHILPMQAGRSTLGNLIIVMQSEDYRTEDIDVEIGFQVKHEFFETIGLSNGLQLSMSALPAIEQMATVVHKGLFKDEIHCYSLLGTWIEENGYQVAGRGREVIMQAIVPGNEDRIFVETQIPVTLVHAANVISLF